MDSSHLPRRQPSVGAGSRRILIVDDERSICTLVALALSAGGLECAWTTTAQQARALLEQRPFDMMIVDLYLGDCTGMELIAHAKTAQPRCKVILLTGLPDADILTEALKQGAVGFFVKPFEIPSLRTMVEGALYGPEPERRLELPTASAPQKSPAA